MFRLAYRTIYDAACSEGDHGQSGYLSQSAALPESGSDPQLLGQQVSDSAKSVLRHRTSVLCGTAHSVYMGLQCKSPCTCLCSRVIWLQCIAAACRHGHCDSVWTPVLAAAKKQGKLPMLREAAARVLC